MSDAVANLASLISVGMLGVIFAALIALTFFPKARQPKLSRRFIEYVGNVDLPKPKKVRDPE